MGPEDLESASALLAALGGAAVVFPAAIALVTFLVLHRELLVVRLVGAFIGFMFPLIAIFGWFVYPRVRSRLAGIGAQLRDAASQAKANVQVQAGSGQATAPQLDLRKLVEQARQQGKVDFRQFVADAQRGASGKAKAAPSQGKTAAVPAVRITPSIAPHSHAPLDPARLLSSDLSVRFNTQLDGDRKLNIPKVVE